MKTAAVRKAFLGYFKQHGHEVVDSSSLVPSDDPTLLFTNAGMNQFKDVFLGRDQRSYSRATSSQRCVRAGGKHNDLENVGYTARHHTFFEMLGNFSFGDYFKQDAIRFAWEFLTSEAWLNIPKDRLYVTIYETDDEAFNVWTQEMGVPADRVIRIGDKGAKYASDNFWQMGDTGPCGPCTEIFYDHGAHIDGGLPGTPEEDGDRYIEIWNVVFMQFNRTADGEMQPLPKPSVDTGMGLERISAIMQNVHSNYEIDLFQDLLGGASDLLGGIQTTKASLRVIADHIRSCSFLISDGVMPSNEGRGNVLRRIIRRAARHGNKLGAQGAFFYKLVAPLVAIMGEAYPELAKAQLQIEKVLLQEEEQFAKTLDKGLALLEQDIEALGSVTMIPGETVFTLYDTYGFPTDLTADIAREHGLTLDMAGYEQAMEAQRERARAASKFGVDYNDGLVIDGTTEFIGYDRFSTTEKVNAVFVDGKAAAASVGQEAVVVLDETPFYAESGGQAGDKGLLRWDGGEFQVTDTQKEGSNHLHVGRVISGSLEVGAQVEAVIDLANRQATALNHSATHLLHSALQKVLGEHVSQKGSLVNSERLRFDFSHFEGVTPEQLIDIERMVNQQVRLNTEVHTEVTDMDTAREKGAMALFGEKYGDTVRLLSMGKDAFSVELCGGTHVKRTGDIGSIVIVSESGIASGVRRIEAVTGVAAEEWLTETDAQLKEVAALVKGNRDSLVEKVRGALDKSRLLEKEIEQLKAKLASSAGNDLAAEAVNVAGVNVLAAKLEGADRKALMDTVDQLKNKLAPAVVLLGTVDDGKVVLVSGVTKDITGKLKAGSLMKEACAIVGGKGGGRPDMAQGGGTEPGKLQQALDSVKSWVENNV